MQQAQQCSCAWQHVLLDSCNWGGGPTAHRHWRQALLQIHHKHCQAVCLASSPVLTVLQVHAAA